MLIAAGVEWPAVRAPLALDDFAQRAMAEGTLTPRRNALDLFNYVDDTNRGPLLERGALPWWTDPGLKLHFFRPWASLLAFGDHVFFGYEAFPPHLQSFLWWVLLVAAAGLLFRACSPGWAASIATVTFALAPSHVIPLVWVANRDSIVATVFATGALIRYLAWREDRRPRDGWAAGLLFSFGLLSGEYAVGIVAYVLAYEVIERRAGLAASVRGAIPILVPLALYAAGYRVLGCGARGSGFYRSPLTDPHWYVQNAPRAISVLAGVGWLGVDDVTWAGRPSGSLWLLSAGTVGALAGATLVLRRLVDETQRRRAFVLLTGSVVSLLPLAATQPSTRLLGIPMLGICGVFGIVVHALCRALVTAPKNMRPVAGLAVVACAYGHLVRPPIYARAFAGEATAAESRDLSYLDTIRAAAGRADTIIVARAVSPALVLWAPFVLKDPQFSRWRVLSQTVGRSVLVRSGPRVVDVLQDGGVFPTGDFDLLRVKSPQPGDQTEIPGMRAAVIEVDASDQPTHIRYEFDRDLDDASVAWIVDGRTGVRRIRAPAVGTAVRLAY